MVRLRCSPIRRRSIRAAFCSAPCPSKTVSRRRSRTGCARCSPVRTDRRPARMAGRVESKVAIVIGAARGIGAALAERLAEEGARVVVADMLEAEGRATAEKLSEQGEATFVATDVSRKDSVDALIEATLARFGRVDILVQNAGICPYTMLPDIPVEEWDAVLGVNLRGCFLAVQACARPMRTQKYGRIVLTSSITGPRVTSPGHGHYSASKAGINGLIRA